MTICGVLVLGGAIDHDAGVTKFDWSLMVGSAESPSMTKIVYQTLSAVPHDPCEAAIPALEVLNRSFSRYI